MRADLIRRLERLEQRIPPGTPEDGLVWQAKRLFLMVLAHDRGGLQEHEPIMAGFARALGYEYRSFVDDLKHDRARISERHGMALQALFVAHGLNPGATDVDEKLALIGRLFEQVPERLRAHIAS